MATRNIYITDTTDPSEDGSIDHPYDSFADINWTTGGARSVFDWVAAGDDVFINLKRGSVWRETLTIGTSGASGHPITIQAYGVGADPIISGADILNNATYKWTDSVAVPGEYHCEIAAGGDPSLTEVENMWKDGTALVNGTVDSLANGEWDWGNNDDLGYNTVYVKHADGDPDGWSDDLEGGQRARCISLREDWIILDGLELCRNNDISWDAPLGMQDANDCIIRNCTLHNGGYASLFIRDTGAGCDDNIFDNCTIHTAIKTTDNVVVKFYDCDSNTLKNSTIYGAANGVGAVVVDLYHSNSNVIENNNIHGPGGNGIYVLGDGTDGNSNVIRYNYIHDVTGIGVQVRGGCDDTEVYYNILVETSPAIDTDGDAEGNDGTLIYNNSMYNSTAAYSGIHVTDINTNCVVKNNIASVTSGDAFKVHANSVAGTTADNNCWFNTSANLIDYDGITYTLAQFATYQAAVTPVDANSIAADPLFVDAANGNFKLRWPSPCINAGADVSLIEDYTGKTIPIGGAFDIGAIETYRETWFKKLRNRLRLFL